MAITGVKHLEYQINRASSEQLIVNGDVAKQIVSLAKKDSGTLTTVYGQTISNQEALEIVDLAKTGETEWGTDSVKLSSGIKINAAAARSILAQLGKGSHQIQVGSGGSVVSKEEVAEVVAIADRGKSRLGYMTKNEVARLKEWQGKAKFAISGKRLLSKVISQGPDRSAKVDPSVSANRVTYPEYGKMFKDGVFDGLTVIGYDENGSHLPEIAKLEKGLQKQGFKPIEGAILTAEDIKKIESLEPKVTVDEMKAANAEKPGVVRYYTHKFTDKKTGKTIIALQRVVLPVDVKKSTVANAPLAKRKEAYIKKFMGSTDAFVYGGHARYGTGPDIDHIKSSAGNIRLAQGYSSKPNVGRRDTKHIKWAKKYQMMVFSGCSTANYMSGLQGSTFKKDRDFVVSNQLGRWPGIGDSVLSTLDAVIKQKSYNDLIPKLGEDSGVSGLFEGRNLKNNSYMPWPKSPLNGAGLFKRTLGDVTGKTKTKLPSSKVPDSDVRSMQQHLSLALPGRAPLELDGQAGPKTRRAIIAFKKANGITPANSDVTRELLGQLNKTVAAKKNLATTRP